MKDTFIALTTYEIPRVLEGLSKKPKTKHIFLTLNHSITPSLPFPTGLDGALILYSARTRTMAAIAVMIQIVIVIKIIVIAI